MPLSDHQKLMARLSAIGIEQPATTEKASTPPQKPPRKQTTHMTGNKHAKKDEVKDAVITVRVTKALKKAAAQAAYPGRLSAFVEDAIKTAVENKNHKPTQ